ncbi:MAG: hypothetical protein H6525_10985 [Actinobacteria bacterium]|nr:hypothetical protein [Actinomycetota bacterium]MCB9413345.1 hypothetical protein [Actinomycetota bacterium]
MRTPLSEGHPPLTLASALTPVRAIGRFVLDVRPWILGLLAVLLAVVRNGIHFDIGSVDFAAGARQLPEPENWFSSSWGPLLVGRVLGLDADVDTWNTGFLIFTLAALVAAAVVILARPTPRHRVALIVLACSPLPTVLLYGIGRYDLFLITGSALVALGRRWWVVVIGALIATSANPEQSIVAAVCLLLVASAPRFRAKRRDAVIFGGIAVVNWIGVTLWFAHYEVDGSRALLFPVWIAKSLQGFVEAFPLSLYSWFGALWLVVLFVVGSLTGRSRWFVIAGLFALPGLFTITTLDGTRVFVCVVTAAALFVVHEQLHTIKHGEVASLLPSPVRSGPDPGNLGAFAGAITIAMIMMPAIYYYGFNGFIGVPWDIVRVPLDEATRSWEEWVQPIVDRFNEARR